MTQHRPFGVRDALGDENAGDQEDHHEDDRERQAPEDGVGVVLLGHTVTLFGGFPRLTPDSGRSRRSERRGRRW